MIEIYAFSGIIQPPATILYELIINAKLNFTGGIMVIFALR